MESRMESYTQKDQKKIVEEDEEDSYEKHERK